MGLRRQVDYNRFSVTAWLEQNTSFTFAEAKLPICRLYSVCIFQLSSLALVVNSTLLLFGCLFKHCSCKGFCFIFKVRFKKPNHHQKNANQNQDLRTRKVILSNTYFCRSHLNSSRFFFSKLLKALETFFIQQCVFHINLFWL